MRIIYEKNITSTFKDKTVFLDTNSIILAMSNPIFLQFLYDLKFADCTLMTISSVLFEFTRGSDTLEVFNKRSEFVLKDLDVGIYPIEKHLDDLREFVVVLQKLGKNIDYTDFLLSCCLYKFKSCFVLTENHSHFLTSLLDRKEIVTIDGDFPQIRNSAFYQFSIDKFEKIAQLVIRNS